MNVFELVSSLLSELVCLLLGHQLESIYNKRKLDVVVFEDLNLLINVTDNGELELILIVDGGEVGLVEHAHGVYSESLSPEMTHVGWLKCLSDIRVETFYAHWSYY